MSECVVPKSGSEVISASSMAMSELRCLEA